MGRYDQDDEAYEDTIELADALLFLEAVLPKGIKGLSPALVRAFERDDSSAALAHARDEYAKRGPANRNASLTHVALLTDRGLTDEASGVLRRAMASHERDVTLQLAQANNMIRQGEAQNALSLLDALRELDLPDPRWWGLMGDMYLDHDRVEDAISCYKQALERASQDPDVAYRLSRLLFDEGQDFDGAIYMERAARIATQDSQLWEMTATVWGQLGEAERASDAWGRVAKLRDDDAEAWHAYGVAQREAGQLREAACSLERAIRLDPVCDEAKLELAHVQLERGYVEEALGHYRAIILDQPSRIEALHGAASASFEQGDVGWAEEYARRAMDLAPDQAESHFNLGLVLRELGRLDEAITSLTRAAEIEEIPDHLIALATALVAAGRIEEADRWIDSIDPGSDEIGGVEARLEYAEHMVAQGQYNRARAIIEAARDDERALWRVLAALLHYTIALLEGSSSEEQATLAEAASTQVANSHEGDEQIMWDFDMLMDIVSTLDRAKAATIRRLVRQIEE